MLIISIMQYILLFQLLQQNIAVMACRESRDTKFMNKSTRVKLASLSTVFQSLPEESACGQSA